ncbi:DASH complex subunit Ask1-domain-containing protein [Mucidula mucida]|nr:DASH complex subunit Ask1-domain-containing protein [Mucidula mucida]
MGTDDRPEIKPSPPRWQPNPDPDSIEVPGLDTSASVNDQIDQIEQLITLKLQNIDENFSKIHNVLANRILPSVKRYAVATEPVREAAQFWTSFYEQAAQIRIPTTDDYSTVNEQTSEREDPESQRADEFHSTHADPHETFDHSITSTGSAFEPDAAYSSTPAAKRVMHTGDATTNDSEASWSASIESPFVRIDRELQKFSIDDEDEEPSLHPSVHGDPSRASVILPQEPSRKGKEREHSEPLLRSVLRHRMYSQDDTITHISPTKKVKTPISPNFNPYLPPNTQANQWNGLVDLNDPAVRTPHGYRYSRKPATPVYDDDDDDSFALPPGMSPPRLITLAMPKSARKPEVRLGRTPTREAAIRITKDLVQGFQPQSMNRYAESSMSTVSSPPSMRRYDRGGTDTSSNVVGESSMESLMERVGLATTPALRLKPKGTGRTPAFSPPPRGNLFSEDGFSTDTYGEPVLTARTPMLGQGGMDDDDDDDDDDAWGDNGLGNSSHPDDVLNLLLSSGGDDDSSFGSSNNSFGNESGEIADVFEDNFPDTMDDDSFGDDGDEEVATETLFGVPPAERMLREQDRNNLVLHGGQMFGDTGLTEQLDNVAESPTPWPRK